MKAYIIRIEFSESNPKIWRKVILPAGGTFGRLHSTVQRVTNFSDTEVEFGGHYYQFNIPEENTIITNNEEGILERRAFQENIELQKEIMREMPKEYMDMEKRHHEEMTKTALYPTKAKFDAYLEKYREIEYIYDFGCWWVFKITLLEIVEDYYFGYPTLLDGAEDAPPEDAGSMDGYYDFLKAYKNPLDRKYSDARAFAERKHFRHYDPEFINRRLKFLKYKKTEWDKINHDNHRILKDPYRKE